MKSLKEQCAAMVATLIDDELAFRLDRLPGPRDWSPLHTALVNEAERRGLRRMRASR